MEFSHAKSCTYKDLKIYTHFLEDGKNAVNVSAENNDAVIYGEYAVIFSKCLIFRVFESVDYEDYLSISKFQKI